MNGDVGLGLLGVRSTWQLAHSARPDAPVVPGSPQRRDAGRLRRITAEQLRRLAERLAPEPDGSYRPGLPRLLT